MIEAYRADANGMFWRVANRAPTEAELSIVTDLWPSTSWDALEAKIRTMRGPTNPTAPVTSGTAASGGFPWLWLVVGALVLWYVLRK